MINENMLPSTFGIFGTCDSIDIFEYMKSEKLKAHVPMRAGSILTADISRTDKNFSHFNHSSSLAKMILHYILNGQVYEFMEREQGEYLLIDLVDERMPLVLFGDYMFLYSPWFRDSNLKEILEKEYGKITFLEHTELPEDFLIERIQLFCERVKAIYPEEKIIINEVRLSDKYITKDNQIMSFSREEFVRWAEKSDTVIQKMYEILKKELPNAAVIQMNKEYYADACSLRGCTPCHFVAEFYQDRFEYLIDKLRRDYEGQRATEVQEIKSFNGVENIKNRLIIGGGGE